MATTKTQESVRRLASIAWSGASRLARRLGPSPVRVPGVRVISVGALAAGGAGKTPLAMAIARRLVRAGVPTAIVLRGYRGAASRSGAIVSDGARVLAGAEDAGDEAMLHARGVPGAIVRIGADRLEAVRRARADGASVVVLDDGFQHVRVARDVDLCAIDAACDRAPLVREGADALDRATLLAVRDAGALPSDPRAFAWTLEPEALVDADLRTIGTPRDLAGRSVVVACGIARPERVIATALAAGARVVGAVFARDHARVASRASRALRTSRAETILTTEKDLVREPARWAALPVAALSMRVVFGAGSERLAAAIASATAT
jgi:tetraacyldisaccharide 4'-kinase